MGTISADIVEPLRAREVIDCKIFAVENGLLNCGLDEVSVSPAHQLQPTVVPKPSETNADDDQNFPVVIGEKTPCSSGENLGKRKRDEEGNGVGCLNSPVAAVELDDPLFATRTKKRQRTVERPKKVNGIVKKVIRKEVAVQEADYSIVKDPEGIARRYQLEVLVEAQQKNTIVYLETGCGKTLIAVLLMKSLAHKLRIPERKKVAIFLAPTVHLVRQQSSVINLHTDLRLGEYFGSLGVDTWKPEKWQEEINNHEVLVMTPQILVDLLTHGIIKLEVIELLIFDECHHAHKKHAYCKIMDKYREVPEHCSRPKVFGMTASPVIRKGVSSGADCQFQLGRLENKLDAKVFAVKDRTELESFVPTPQTQGIDFDAPFVDIAEYRVKLQAIAIKYQQFEAARHGSAAEQFKDYEDLGRKLQKSIHRFHNALVYCLVELGLWCAHKAAELLLKNDFKDIVSEPDMDVVTILKNAKEKFLKEAIEILNSPLPEDPCSTDEEMDKAVKLGQLTPKVQKLVDVLVKYRDLQDMRCIVFVDRVVGALILSHLINNIRVLSFLRCEYLAGINGALDAPTRIFQDQVILKFRTGKLNLLVATNVAEEGLDVQGCHSVVRFDICKTVRSYIQSRGRARRPGSDYIVFMEKGNERQKEDFSAIIQSESKMIESALDRAVDQIVNIMQPVAGPAEVYRVESTGASLTTDSSIGFIYRFCSKLPGDKYYIPRPEFIFTEEPDKMHVCTLKLPPNASFHELVGPKRKTTVMAKQAACLEACKLLHSMGAINDYLLPVIDDGKVEEEDIMNLKTLKNRGAGTTKRKELHGTKAATKLRGSWGTTSKGERFHAYNLIFSEEEHDSTFYANFALLVETKLDDDVARLEVELALKAGRMGRANFFPAGEVALSLEQIKDCKDSQEVFFNGMFSKLLTRASKVSGPEASKGFHKSLVIANDEDRLRIWDKNKMYLLLPIRQYGNNRNDVKAIEDLGTLPIIVQPDIDWESVKRTAEAARMFWSIYRPSAVISSPSISENAIEDQPTAVTSRVSNEDLRMAFGVTSKVSDIENTVVLTVHTGMIYCITKVLFDITANCPFPQTNDNEEQKLSSYSDYFLQKHKQVLRHPQQPMLQAKQTHRPRNLLARNSLIGLAKGKRKKKATADVSENCYIELPPELCIVLGVSDAVVRSAYLLPSVMHTLDSALAASQLRESIAKEFPHPVIPVMRIVEALTTLRCLEEFSLEGLELLGDSFLKYAWSKNLFLTYDRKHEGQLSARRCRQICNAKLHDLALKRDLPEYIRDEVFDPSRWVPPGMHCPKILLCRCNLANLHHSRTPEAKDADKPKQIQKVVKIGKSCANGHRWLCSKTISDVVEALIGAYLVDSDDDGALNFMTWVGMDVKVDQSLVEKAKAYAACDPTVNVGADLQGLEARLQYSFKNKALLVEAITHASHQELKGGFCYQRLEFLGDAVLDYLITRHLYFSHPGLTPGRLTDLRSAAVNNECFARIAVKHCLNKYLRHGSGFLLKQIEEFVQSNGQPGENEKDASYGWDGVRGPKVLGDLVESIAGAVLVDTGFDLETVWVVMRPLLSPIVTPATLPLHPVRELQELCHIKDYKVVLKVEPENVMTRVTIDVTVMDEVLSATSTQLQKKTAQKDAAQQMLALLKLQHKSKTNEGLEQPYKVTVDEGPQTPAKVLEQPSAPPGCKRKLDKLNEGEEGEGKKVRLAFEPPQDSAYLNSAENVSMSCSAVLLCSDEHRKEIEAEGQPVVVPF